MSLPRPVLSWQPGGAVIAQVDPTLVPAVALPAEATRLHEHGRVSYHVTLIGRASLAAVAPDLAEVWPQVLASMRDPPVPVLRPVLALAVDRRKHKRTWFLRVENQADFAQYVRDLAACLARYLGGVDFQHRERDRFFHVSVANDRAGDPIRSIGAITRQDWQRSTGRHD